MAIQENETYQTQMELSIASLRDDGKGQRYAIIGCEGGTYHAMQEKLERQNITCIDRLLAAGKAKEAVELLKQISISRRNIKQHSILKAFAILARSNDKAAKTAAYAALSEVCRIPTHLFMFIKFCEEESSPGTGWGRAHKRAIARWYTNFKEKPEELARLVTKFKNREQWRHRDVVRLAHPSCRDNEAVAFIIRYIVKDLDKATDMYQPDLKTDNRDLQRVSELLNVYERALNTRNVDELCDIIETYKLSWEQCPTELLRKKKVWCALLEHMPIEAMVRNLGRMSALGMFAANSEEEENAVRKIKLINKEQLKQQIVEDSLDLEVDGELPCQQNVTLPSQQKNERKKCSYLHPFKILVALYTYKAGHGEKGKLAWAPNGNILKALEQAFYQAFDKVEPTNKKYFLAVDVSGSMSQPVLGNSSIDCATAAAAMMMVTKRAEERKARPDETRVIVKGFSHQLMDIEIEPEDTLESVKRKVGSLPMGATDCSLPMKCAMEEKMKDIDVFIVYTDNETWYGNIHPFEALNKYRKYSENDNVKLVVCGMCSTEFTIADPTDRNMMDVVGFDPNAPRVISEFVLDRI